MGDSGYPLEPYLMTPYRSLSQPAHVHFNETHVKARNGVLKNRFRSILSERGFHYIPKRWPKLSMRDVYYTIFVSCINIILKILHNTKYNGIKFKCGLVPELIRFYFIRSQNANTLTNIWILGYFSNQQFKLLRCCCFFVLQVWENNNKDIVNVIDFQLINFFANLNWKLLNENSITAWRAIVEFDNLIV